MPLRPVLTALAAVLLLAGGCGTTDTEGSDEPTAGQPPVDGPPSTAPGQSDEVEAVVERWADAEEELLATGDGTAYRAIAHPDCRSCDDAFTTIKGHLEDGVTIESGAWGVTGVETLSAPGESPIHLSVTVDTEEVRFIAPDGTPLVSQPAGAATYAIQVVETDAGLRLVSVAKRPG